MVKHALDKARREAEEKVPLSFKIPVALKKQFEEFCNKHKVSMSAMVGALIETALHEEANSHMYSSVAKYLSVRARELEQQIDEIEQVGGDHPSALAQIGELKKELVHVETMIRFFGGEQ